MALNRLYNFDFDMNYLNEIHNDIILYSIN